MKPKTLVPLASNLGKLEISLKKNIKEIFSISEIQLFENIVTIVLSKPQHDITKYQAHCFSTAFYGSGEKYHKQASPIQAAEEKCSVIPPRGYV